MITVPHYENFYGPTKNNPTFGGKKVPHGIKRVIGGDGSILCDLPHCVHLGKCMVNNWVVDHIYPSPLRYICKGPKR